MKTILALTLLAMAPAIGRAQDQLADALRKGIVEEDVNHNLNAAIQNYQSALSRFNEERTAAATALFRLAECYRKLGKSKEASDAYNRVVTEFADQNSLVAKSLQHIGKPPGAPAREPESAEARRRYRALLQEKLDMAAQHLNEVNKQLQLGSAGPSDGTDAAMAMVHAEREMAAFDAGLLGPQAPGAGADVEAEDGNGRTALAVAMLNGDREAMSRLHAAGAKQPEAIDASDLRARMAEMAGSVKKLVPSISVPDIGRTLDWYTSIGFQELGRYEDDGVVNWGMLSFGKAELMLGMRGKSGPHDLSLWFYVSDVDKLYQLLKARQLEAAQAVLASRPADHEGIEFEEDIYDPFYGGRQFSIRDPNGYTLVFYAES